MKLPGDQFDAFTKALLDSYNAAALEHMVRIKLDVILEHITRPGPLTVVVGDLVSWAEHTDNITALLTGACSYNPGNAALQALTARAQAEAWFTNPSPTSSLPAAPSSRVALIKQKALNERLFQLITQYEAGMAQLNSNLSAIDAIKIQYQLRSIEADMRSVEEQLQELGS